MMRNWKGLISAGLGMALIGTLGGCAVSKTEHELAMQENQELRERLNAEQSARHEAELRNASLEQENRDLATSADRLRIQQTARPGAGTGFEAIGGLSSYRTSGGEVVVEIAGDVLFDSGSVAVKTSSRRSLDQVAQVISSRYPNNMIRVEGYTDTDPIRRSNWKTNERLSGERAMAVQEYLISKGVPRQQIYFAGFGDTRPRGTKQQSRRVEIVILAQQR
jgi:chemotaxis protein MotB